MSEVVDELKALGCRVTLRSTNVRGGGLVFQLEGSSEYSPELNKRVAEVMTRHGYRETREGMWFLKDATEEEINQAIHERAETDEYRRLVRAVRDNPDWSDEEIADFFQLDIDEVNYFRSRDSGASE